jgi:hypothetical protein
VPGTADTGLADDLEAWEQYERASHGRKQVTFSRGRRRRYRLAKEESDDEIADRDMGGDDVIALPAGPGRPSATGPSNCSPRLRSMAQSVPRTG